MGVRLVVVKMVRPLRWLMGGARMGVGVGIRRMFPTLVRKLRHGPLCEGPQGPRRDLDEGRSRGNAGSWARLLQGRQSATRRIWCGRGVWTVDWPGRVWSSCLVARSLGSPWGQQNGPPSDSVRDPSPACPVLSRSCSCLVQSWPVSPSRGRGSELKRCCSAAVLQVCRCWRPSVSRRAWMTLTILDLGFGLFGDQSRGRAAQEPGWPGAGQERANRLSPWLGLDVGIMDAPGLGLPACRRDKEGKSILGTVAYPKHHDCGSAPQHGERERRSGGGVESE